MSPLIGIATTMGALLLMFGLLKLYELKCQPHPEVLRKALHSGMGAVTLCFPWLFHQTWPVWLLAISCILLLVAIKKIPALARHWSGIVDGVKRVSFGDLYFPLAVAALFQLSDAGGNRVLYLVPIMLMTFADAAAALVGIRFGRHRFQIVQSHKSIEGSLSFFAVGFFCVYFPLLIFTSLDHVIIIMVALLVAALAMLLEAVAWAGLDNLFVPLGTYLLLLRVMPLSSTALIWRLLLLAILFSVVLAAQRIFKFSASKTLVLILIGYAAVTLVG